VEAQLQHVLDGSVAKPDVMPAVTACLQHKNAY
jgi:hypothetical protein